MRLVDADALMKSMYHRAFETDGDTMWQSGCWVRYRAIEQTVKEQPTIEPMRKRGKWISADAIFGGVPFYCSECGWSMLGTANFCHNCGADMKGEEE